MIRYERSYHLISRGVANRARRSYRGGGTARSGVPKMRFGRHRTRDLDVEPLRASVEPVVQYDISRLLLYCDCYYCDVSAATSAATATGRVLLTTATTATTATTCYRKGTAACYPGRSATPASALPCPEGTAPGGCRSAPRYPFPRRSVKA